MDHTKTRFTMSGVKFPLTIGFYDESGLRVDAARHGDSAPAPTATARATARRAASGRPSRRRKASCRTGRSPPVPLSGSSPPCRDGSRITTATVTTTSSSTAGIRSAAASTCSSRSSTPARRGAPRADPAARRRAAAWRSAPGPAPSPDGCATGSGRTGGSWPPTSTPASSEQLTEKNLEVRRHDIVADELEEDAFDLVHSRLVLDHLPEREQVVQPMAAALRPGGWLVLESFDWSSLRRPPPAAAPATWRPASTRPCGRSSLPRWRPDYGRLPARSTFRGGRPRRRRGRGPGARGAAPGRRRRRGGS